MDLANGKKREGRRTPDLTKDSRSSPETDSPESRSNRLATKGGEHRYRETILQLGLYGALLILIGFFSVCSPYFFTVTNAENILLQANIVGMVAIAQTFVIVSGGIDLSVGSMIGLTGVTAGFVALRPDTGPILPFFAAITMGALAGAVNGGLIAMFRIPPFIVTLASLYAARGLALILTNTQNLYGFNPGFKFVGAGRIAGFPIIILIFISLSVIAYVLQEHTRFARHVYAIGGGRRAAEFFGVSVRRVELILYAVSGAVAGLAGAALAARVASAEPTAGIGFELTAIAAVIIGGTSLSGGEGGVQRSIVGMLILAIISNGLNLMAVPSYYQQVISAAVIVVAVVADQWSKARAE